MKLSYWEQEYFLKGTDIAIIGGGIVGLTTSIFLKKRYPNSKIVIYERNFPGAGASTKNAGFVCFGSPSEIFSDLDIIGREALVSLIRDRWNGVKMLFELIDPTKCEYEQMGGFEYFTKSSHTTIDSVFRHIDLINDIVYEAVDIKNVFKVKSNINFPSFFNKYVFNKEEGQFNPMLMHAALTKKAMEIGVKIAYNMEVSEININTQELRFSSGENIFVKQMIIANNGFAKRLLPELKIYSVRNQVLMTSPIRNNIIKGSYHLNEGYIYFRNYKDRILIGGARNIDLETEKTTEFGENKFVLNYLKTFLKTAIIPDKNYTIDRIWSGILGVGENKKPNFKSINDKVHIGVKLGGMGIAIGTKLGFDLSELIKEKL